MKNPQQGLRGRDCGTAGPGLRGRGAGTAGAGAMRLGLLGASTGGSLRAAPLPTPRPPRPCGPLASSPNAAPSSTAHLPEVLGGRGRGGVTALGGSMTALGGA